MEQLFQQMFTTFAGWFWSVIVILIPFIAIDLMFLKGKYTGKLMEGIFNLLGRIPGLILGSVWQGLRAGWRATRPNNQNQQRRGGRQIDVNINVNPDREDDD